MDFFEVINNRYSYRGTFTDEKLSDEEISLILKSAIAAPSGMNIKTTSYIAITDEDIINKLGKIIKGNGTKTAPFVLVLLTEDKSGVSSMNFEIENYSAACQNILLSVTALGCATVWTDGILRAKEINDAVRSLLNIPQNKTIRAVLPIGKPTKDGEPKEKKPIEELVVFNTY